MHSKRRPFLPFFLLLSFVSFAAILLYSCHYSSSLPPSLSSANSSPNSSKFKFVIKVLAYNRLAPLKRCLHSLSRAQYGSDRVDLHIHLDHFKQPESKNRSVIQERIDSDHQILDFLDGFRWRNGEKQIMYNSENRGLQAQWIQAWWPQSNDEFAFIVEDDLELSPLFYQFLKKAIMIYYYDKSNYDPSVFGISLQRPRFVAGKHGNKIELDGDTRLLLYQMVGTWGQLLFPKPWKEFRLWYNDHKAKDIKPLLQGMVTTGWYKKMGERIWTPWFIKFIHTRGYFNIYTNFGRERALSVSHRDAGVNYGKNAGPDSDLIMKKTADFELFRMKPLGELRWYNFCFKEVFPGRIVNRLNQLENVLKTVQNDKTVTLVSLHGTRESVVRNLICYFEKNGLQNYVFWGDDLELLHDLARRGHPVIYGNNLLVDEISGMDFTKLTVVKGYLIRKFLELGYNIWLMDGNMVPVTNALPKLFDQSFDFLARDDVELMFLRNSLNTRKFWNDNFISHLAGKNKYSEKVSFVGLISKALEKNNHLKVGTLDEWIVLVSLSTYNKDSTVSGRDTVVYWSGLSPVERELQKVDLWLLDEDSSCNAVVCHPQLKPS
ncbi:transferring glycosyl group transferase [Rhynchospora pubera]|uniref:Transferring glycosyl group transferase n=1 Tax=Rhynchospora pubera TaxID=906938 RepID=A0AAV8E0M5_9POAL|nr:transferring glycosyl group transferase [Rhynchospora pubera]